MQAEEKCMELTGELFQEFEETRKLAENEDSVTYSTWTRVCSSVYRVCQVKCVSFFVFFQRLYSTADFCLKIS